MNKIFVGIDVSKDNFVVSGKNEKFVFENRKFNMDKEGFEKFENLIKSLGKDVVLGVEPTGIYHFNLLKYLEKKNYKISMVNPYKVKQFFKFVSNKPTKNDKIDSNIISQYLQFSSSKSSESSYNSQKGKIKYLVREKEYLTNQIAYVKTEIKRLLCILWPELERKFKVLPSYILSILKLFPSAHSVRKVSFDQFKEKIQKIHKHKGRKIKLPLYQIYQLATCSISSYWPEFENLLKMKIQQLQFLNKQLIKIEGKIVKLSEKYFSQQIKILTSIPGIGKTSAIYFISEIQDIKRFSNYKKLVGFCGLDPTIFQSGKYKGQYKISKRGNAHARRIVYLMAESVRKYVPEFTAYYRKKRSEGKSHNQSVIACSTKLIKLIYTLLIENRVFI